MTEFQLANDLTEEPYARREAYEDHDRHAAEVLVD